MHINGPLVGYIILLVGIGALYYKSVSYTIDSRNTIVQSGRAVAVASCNRAFENRQALRRLLEAAQAISKARAKRGDITPSEAKLTEDFYQTELRRLNLPNCEQALYVLSDDPNKKITIPTPLRP